MGKKTAGFNVNGMDTHGSIKCLPDPTMRTSH